MPWTFTAESAPLRREQLQPSLAEASAYVYRTENSHRECATVSSVFDNVMQQVGGSNLSRISQQIGADEATTQTAVQAALPMLLGGLARNSARPEGAAALGNALNDHRGSLLENLGSLLGDPDSGPGAGILGHIFGNRRENVEEGVGKATGLDRRQIGKLLTILAPIVMAVLARKAAPRADASPGDGSLGPMLEQETREAAQKAPSGLGGLISMLDRDKDGNPLNDLGALGGLFGSR
jgi:hypothetical protein